MLPYTAETGTRLQKLYAMWGDSVIHTRRLDIKVVLANWLLSLLFSSVEAFTAC